MTTKPPSLLGSIPRDTASKNHIKTQDNFDGADEENANGHCKTHGRTPEMVSRDTVRPKARRTLLKPIPKDEANLAGYWSQKNNHLTLHLKH